MTKIINSAKTIHQALIVLSVAFLLGLFIAAFADWSLGSNPSPLENIPHLAFGVLVYVGLILAIASPFKRN
jgi:hypothetical protein